MVGEARLIAHGSAGGALLLGAAAVPDAALLAAPAPEVVVACGVLATVESPEPQPLSIAAAKMTVAMPVSGAARFGSNNTWRTVPRFGFPGATGGAPGAVTRHAQLR